ncbi:hypothetical protein P6F26_12375 [Roseibacterium sp. SDUM158017]|uniref:hypothetical protein n=1 Tax=Roseicyclus salinarum TaxID=3036773 RepID=UPI0024157CDF|nr:hypothetical protein [Roseibacterium sp. SDUM158017]MDG4649244.1 hypothetical protein [Roseibacterium sp. SDUM158017]
MRDVLRACVIEAERQADALGRIDNAVGEVLAAGTRPADMRMLQTVDLLRQEAQALSRILRLVSEGRSPDVVLSGADLAARIPLAEQRARLTS